MHHNGNKQTMLFLASDELMQTHLSCTKIKDSNIEDIVFTIRAFCYALEDDLFAKSTILNLILGLNKDGLGMSLAIDLTNIPNVNPIQLRKIVEHLQKSPVLLQVVSNKLDAIAASGDFETATQAKRAKQFFVENSPKGITAFSTNRQANQLYWLNHNNQIITNITPFTVDEKGGHIAFTIRVGFKHDFIMQCYEVECLMHLFNEGDKLGYYFELYLDQEDYHHQLLYEEMPDQFMRNKAFLRQILEQMKKCNTVHYDEYLQELIEKFTASI
ncbi:MAG: cysteine methyltransferase [Solibacillus sp.]|uniref:cysteine methyltransferase n=1 Tax=unclassified Solibacillus TaxID=2637870 RepID=UPI0030F5D56A